MINRRFAIFKNKLSKRLLAVILFFSLFVFSGYTGNSQPQTPQETYTELVFSPKYNTHKRAFLYQTISAAPKAHILIKKANQHICSLLLAHNRLYREKISSISISYFSFKTAPRFTQVKTIPQGSVDDAFSSLIG